MSSGKAKRVGKYELCETIGRGTFSKVKRGLNTETGEIVAIKIINITSLQKEGMEKQMKREISVLKSIQHENVVSMIEVLKSSNHFYIVMELVTGGELFDKIVQQKRFDEKTARRYFQALIDGLAYCHAKKIAHRDLKPENLLLNKNDILKISDFGLSGLAGDKMLSTICGTPHYVAPEVLSGSYDGICADIWSCGIILFVMLSGCHPFDGDSVAELFNRIENLEFKYPTYFSKDARTLLDKIIVVDPKKRATMEDIKNDPWFLKTYSGESKSRKSIKIPTDEEAKDSIIDADIEFEKKERSGRLSVRMQHSEPLNAFEIITQVAMKGKINPLAKKEKNKNTAGSISTNFAAEGFPDRIYEDMNATLKGMKCDLRTKETSYTVKARLKGIHDVEFTTHVLPVNNVLVIVELTKVKGNTLKFHDIFRQLKTKFGYKIDEQQEQHQRTLRRDLREVREPVVEEKKEEKKVEPILEKSENIEVEEKEEKLPDPVVPEQKIE
jgi:serine/threonine protein kinase